MGKKMSLQEYFKKNEVFKPKTQLHKLPEYQLTEIISFLNRNEKMILDMSLEGDKFRNISDEEFYKTKKDTEAFLKEDERSELYPLYYDNDFSLVDEEYVD